MAGDDDSDRDSARIAAILDDARATRKRPSRTMWIAAAIVGIACAIAFALLVTGDGAAPASDRLQRANSHERGWGFGAGLVVGLVAGIAIGVAIARQRHSSRNSP